MKVMAITHGTVSGYQWHKCRCTDCKAAMSEYNRDQRDKLAQRVVPERVHGTITGYTSYRCRCQPCKEAGRAYHRERRETF